MTRRQWEALLTAQCDEVSALPVGSWEYADYVKASRDWLAKYIDHRRRRALARAIAWRVEAFYR